MGHLVAGVPSGLSFTPLYETLKKKSNERLAIVPGTQASVIFGT
jgi:hypothetical protein